MFRNDLSGGTERHIYNVKNIVVFMPLLTNIHNTLCKTKKLKVKDDVIKKVNYVFNAHVNYS